MGNRISTREGNGKKSTLKRLGYGVTRVPRNARVTVQFTRSSSDKGERIKPENLPSERAERGIILSPNVKAFSLGSLEIATMDFSPDNIIGEGGFGYVYKGWIDEKTLGAAKPGNGMAVAVKKLRSEGLQGHKEWLSEINHLSQLHHPNLVKLLGYCRDGDNRFLVYEFLSKGNLEEHLFGRGVQPLPWAMRIKVAIGAARGLSFLHNSEPQVILRDFKTSNILLDSDFNAKLSDFGFAKAGPTDGHSHVSSQIVGTEGYAAPEYVTTGRLTARCDVYSFGVVLLELLTGRPALDRTKTGVEQSLVEWVTPYLVDKRKLFRIIDIKLEGKYSHKGAFVIALLALHCISQAKLRPQMTEVLSILESIAAVKRRTKSCPEQEIRISPVPESSLGGTDNIFHFPSSKIPPLLESWQG